MRATVLLLTTLLSFQAHAAKPGIFNQHCMESESIMASVQNLAPESQGLTCHRAQLSPDDLAQIKSVQPSLQAPVKPTVITGLTGNRAQLGEEDISHIQAVQPAEAVLVLDRALY